MTSAAAPAIAVVVGGGPAGLMAAEVLASSGLDVTVFEQKATAGRKFLLAGRGGLNLTHAEDLDRFLGRYGERRAELEPAVRDFTPDALRAWCSGLGHATFVGTSGRVFPEQFRSTKLLRAWLGRLADVGVHFEFGARWTGLREPMSDGRAGLGLRFERAGASFAVEADVAVFALGGGSWPRTGSDGGWVDAFAAAGVRVAPLVPANCGVAVPWSELFVERFEGAPLKNVAAIVDGAVVRGDPIVTRSGLEGGPIYAHSKRIRRNIDESGSAGMTIDLRPDLSHDALTSRLTTSKPKESMSRRLRRAGFDPVAVGLLREGTGNRLPTDAAAIAELAKSVPVMVRGLLSLDRSISTAGGIAFDEIDDRFMLRRLPGVFVAGEMLDWEAPTGGYLLQATFSTAVAAARGAVAWLERCD